MKGMDTYSLLPENEYTEVEGRRYLSPTLDVAQTNDFINNLRSNQQAQNVQIAQQTQNLGTRIPSSMGGLTGGTGYWTSRYQTPQTNNALQNLMAATRADALKTALANEKARMQKQYQEAYRAQQKSAYDKSVAASSGGNVNTQTLGYDVNSGSIGGSVSVPTNLAQGVYTPVTSKMGYFLSPSGSVWQLSAPTLSEQFYNLGIAPGIGSVWPQVKNVTENGQTVDMLGKTFMLIKDSAHPNGAWYTARNLGSM